MKGTNNNNKDNDQHSEIIEETFLRSVGFF